MIGVSLNAAVDKTASVEHLVPGDDPPAPGPVGRPRRQGGQRGASGTAPGPGWEIVAVLGGHAGAWYRAALAERSIPLHAVEVAGETRTCLSVLDIATGA